MHIFKYSQCVHGLVLKDISLIYTVSFTHVAHFYDKMNLLHKLFEIKHAKNSAYNNFFQLPQKL